jgi:hypothetical protein
MRLDPRDPCAASVSEIQNLKSEISRDSTLASLSDALDALLTRLNPKPDRAPP